MFVRTLVLTAALVAAASAMGWAGNLPNKSSVPAETAVGNPAADMVQSVYPWSVYYKTRSGNWLLYRRYAYWYQADQAARDLYLNWGYWTRILRQP